MHEVDIHHLASVMSHHSMLVDFVYYVTKFGLSHTSLSTVFVMDISRILPSFSIVFKFYCHISVSHDINHQRRLGSSVLLPLDSPQSLTLSIIKSFHHGRR